MNNPIERLKRDAKVLFRAVRAGEAAAQARAAALFHGIEASPSGFSLMRSQHVIATEHEFKSWKELLLASRDVLQAKLELAAIRSAKVEWMLQAPFVRTVLVVTGRPGTRPEPEGLFRGSLPQPLYSDYFEDPRLGSVAVVGFPSVVDARGRELTAARFHDRLATWIENESPRDDPSAELVEMPFGPLIVRPKTRFS